MDQGDGRGSLTAGIEQEIRSLYETHALGMLRYALTVSGNREAARDAVQEVFLRFFVARVAGQQILHPRAWLFRVLRNHALDQKKAGFHREVGLDSLRNTPGLGPSPEMDYSRFEVLRRTLRTTLSPREIECVQLRAEGLRYDEIAAALNLRSGTVGALLARAHKKVRQAAGAAGRKSGNLGLEIATGKHYAS
jgi:RNA polymerase sigma-70 factor (ECF subfamily)